MISHADISCDQPGTPELSDWERELRLTHAAKNLDEIIWEADAAIEAGDDR